MELKLHAKYTDPVNGGPVERIVTTKIGGHARSFPMSWAKQNPVQAICEFGAEHLFNEPKEILQKIVDWGVEKGLRKKATLSLPASAAFSQISLDEILGNTSGETEKVKAIDTAAIEAKAKADAEKKAKAAADKAKKEADAKAAADKAGK